MNNKAKGSSDSFIDLTKGKKTDLKAPFSYEKSYEAIETRKAQENQKELLMKKAWSTATAPISQIFMNLFMMWMMGSSLHIFTIFFLFGIMSGPIKSLMAMGDTFRQFENKGFSLLTYKATYIAINGALCFLGAYKLYGIGLLPLSPADHVDWVPKREVIFFFEGKNGVQPPGSQIFMLKIYSRTLFLLI